MDLGVGVPLEPFIFSSSQCDHTDYISPLWFSIVLLSLIDILRMDGLVCWDRESQSLCLKNSDKSDTSSFLSIFRESLSMPNDVLQPRRYNKNVS